ncbi:MAG: hypothetical protein QF689_01090 [Candidatus Latescibacteria bacterium]|jgi:hypothetical protein|nr:hypothetical protein [Candidatus Latescibacterota bacterium]MDP7447156.1 hypothetical protein [Candidatus Latescibacterota bacterium]
MRFSICLLALLLVSAPATAVTIDGRATGSAYAYEGGLTDSTASTFVRSHGAIRLQAADLGHRGLSLSTYLRGTTDLSEAADDDPAVRVYNLYLRYKDRYAEIRAGRQRVSAGVGYGTIDGARIDLKRYDVGLTLFGGAQIPVNGHGLGALSNAYLWGLRLRSNRLAGVKVAVSYADRERDPIQYGVAGRFSGFLGQPEAIRRQLIGAEASRRFGLHSLRARLDYDLQDETVRRGELSGRIGLSADVAVQAGWRHREPSVYRGSIFSVFPSQGYNEWSLRAHYRLSSDIALSAHAATLIYDDDSTQRLGLSASFGRHLTIGYRRYQGYAGGSDGLSGSLLYSLGRTLTLRGDLDLSSFERFEAEDSDGLVTAVAGLSWRLGRRSRAGCRRECPTADPKTAGCCVHHGSWRSWPPPWNRRGPPDRGSCPRRRPAAGMTDHSA